MFKNPDLACSSHRNSNYEAEIDKSFLASLISIQNMGKLDT